VANAHTLKTTVEIVRKPAEQRWFVVHTRRGVVERSLSWLTAHRWLACDYERRRRQPAFTVHRVQPVHESSGERAELLAFIPGSEGRDE
jgi:hypothetical protein